jgi:hypothetical protein
LFSNLLAHIFCVCAFEGIYHHQRWMSTSAMSLIHVWWFHFFARIPIQFLYIIIANCKDSFYLHKKIRYTQQRHHHQAVTVSNSRMGLAIEKTTHIHTHFRNCWRYCNVNIPIFKTLFLITWISSAHVKVGSNNSGVDGRRSKSLCRNSLLHVYILV